VAHIGVSPSDGEGGGGGQPTSPSRDKEMNIETEGPRDRGVDIERQIQGVYIEDRGTCAARCSLLAARCPRRSMQALGAGGGVRADADAGRWFLYNKGNEITHRVPHTGAGFTSFIRARLQGAGD
jgi:hypothetical protein